jgi:trehalose 6-phosphate phosphatase
MAPAHHAAGQEPPDAVKKLAADPGATSIVTDFDGTLALVVADPEAVWAIDGVVDSLAAAARSFRRTAVVSGRPASFLLSRLTGTDGQIPAGVSLAGLYGMELVEGDTVTVHPDALTWVPEVDKVVAAAEAGAPPGVGIERKGLSVTLHVRTVPHEAHWAETFAEAHARLSGLVVHPGRMSWELRPPVDVDKGTTVDDIIAGSTAACFMGDDIGDLPAFDALDRFAAAGGHAVRIAVDSAEAPRQLMKRADVVADGPAAAVDLLAWLAQAGAAAAS